MSQMTIMVKPVSGLCDLRCAYCFYADETAHRETAFRGRMTEETTENLIRRAFLFAEDGLNLVFQGGEPTLAGLDYYRKVLALEKKYNTAGIPVHHAIQTNGYGLDRAWCELFREGGFLVGVSLDGTQEIHDRCRRTPAGGGTFDRIQRVFPLLREAGVPYNILCVLTEDVGRQPERVFGALKEHRYLQFIPCLDGLEGNGGPYSLRPETYGTFLIRLFDLYEQAYRSGRPVSVRTFDNWLDMLSGLPPENCAMSGRCGNYFLVEADGSVYPCDFYALDAWKTGNVNESGFARISRSPAAAEFIRQSVPLPAACRGCRWIDLCRGGCRRDREPFRDGVPSVSRLCAGTRMFFEQRGQRLQKLAEDVRKQARP